MKQSIARGRKPILLPLAVGAILTALTLVLPTELGWAEWLTMIPIFVALYRFDETHENRRIRGGRAYAYGFFTVYVYYFVLWHWIVRMYPMSFLGVSPAVSIAIIVAAWFGLPLLQAFFGGWMFWIYHRISKSGAFLRAPLLRPFVIAALWTVFEWSSTLGWIGVPWGRLALGQISLLPMLQSASLLGSYFVSFLILLVNGLLAYVLLYPQRSILCRRMALCLLACNLLFGTVRMQLPGLPEENTVTVAVLQGNIDSTERWSEDGWMNFREVYYDLTVRAAAEGAELIVWPETTFPYAVNTSTTSQHFLSNLASEQKVSLIVGGLYEDAEGNYSNVLYFVDPDGTIRDERYSKRHLVPFGEYVPMRPFFEVVFPPLTEMTTFEDLVQGEDPVIMGTAFGKVGCLICFDSIYEQLTLDSVRAGAEVLVLASNDSWFYDSVGVYMHQAQAQLRAIESGRHVARAAGTGISSIVDEHGEIRIWLDPLTKGYAVDEVAFHSSMTLYAVVGNLLVWLAMAFTLGVWGWGIVTRGSAKAMRTPSFGNAVNRRKSS